MPQPPPSKIRLFGTDGIRGPFGDYPLDRPTVTEIGRQLGELLAEGAEGRAEVVLGGDTRASTGALAHWIATGLAAADVGVRYVGTLPTPGIAQLSRHLADAGVAISASHNPWRDNGIKLIAADGFKWKTTRERELESRLRGASGAPPTEPAAAIPAPEVESDLVERYRRSLLASSPGPTALSGLRIAVDAANGAASDLAEPVLTALGAEVTTIFAAPNGENINLDCGSTHPEALCALVADGGFDLGVAFDGDADRALFVDDRGRLVDGDATLFLWARHLQRLGTLEPARIVATSMSNLGLERALAVEGIEVVRCGVGDRQVVEAMLAGDIQLGGEQSGHIVHLGLSTTGDGLLTAIQLAALIAASKQSMSELLAGFRTYPQTLKNLVVTSKPPLEELPAVQAAVETAAAELGSEGRIVLRYSGTEPLARVMIEGPDQALLEGFADDILDAIATELGESNP